jgi:hypothetical protein
MHPLDDCKQLTLLYNALNKPIITSATAFRAAHACALSYDNAMRSQRKHSLLPWSCCIIHLCGGTRCKVLAAP